MYTDPTGACVGWMWRDPTCQFIGRDQVRRGNLAWAEGRPWGGAAIDFVPVIGDIKGLIEVFTGCDLVTGEDLGAWRWAGLLFLGELRHLRHADDIGGALRLGNAAPVGRPGRAAAHGVAALRMSTYGSDAGWAVRQSRAPGTAFSPVNTASVDFLEETGRRGGILYGERRLAMLKNYLNRRGVDLFVGDAYLPRNKVGGFDYLPERPALMLRSDPTEYEVWHELSHYIQYRRIGREAYANLPRTKEWHAPEQFVYDMLNRSRRWSKLNEAEQMHANEYIERIGGFR